jgi:UDP-N-acetylmuramoyl-tripeptide--D-alanyl-D-alanine ligase
LANELGKKLKMIELKLSEIAPVLGAIHSGKDVKITGITTDTRKIKAGCLYIALSGERFDGHDFVKTAQEQGASAVIVEKPVSSDLPSLRVTNTRKALGDLAKFWLQRFDLPVIAITGSNGKTTTKEMLKSILSVKTSAAEVLANEGNLNNDIGVPLTLFNLQAQHRYAVIEMGANHRAEIAYLTSIAQPSCATITHCAPAHLEGFGSIEGVALTKGEIFSNLKADGIAIINNDDEYASLWKKLATPHTIQTFALNNSADVTAIEIQLNDNNSNFTLKTPKGEISIHLPLLGQHNIMNALTASACALASGCSLAEIQQGLQNMQAVKGRLQITKVNNIILIDDTYNANPASLKAALAILNKHPSPAWLVLGDMNELGSQSANFHQEAGELARKIGVERLWALGKLSKHAVESFGTGGQHFENQENLIKSIRNQLSLSPQTTILIKGSRGMQMEKVVNALQEQI